MTDISIKINAYTRAEPSAERTLGLFEGRWACAVPVNGVLLGNPNGAQAFNDPRVHWFLDGMREASIVAAETDLLEFGPLEGAHTYQLAKAGFRSITSIEANPEAYLKCLVVKETLGIERVNFLYGESTRYLQSTDRQFHVGFASGILYHMVDPIGFLRLVAGRCRVLFLWTVCWEREFMAKNQEFGANFDPPIISESGIELYRNNYGSDQKDQFWGGGEVYSHWLTVDGVKQAVEASGFRITKFDVGMTAFGPWVMLLAIRTSET
ncbi:hypothetical protein [Nibricoccus sp. IMCC34717]|uniref:hypothetical protein n=1 Tax=Nibricoccus sp. IMCC34717 TaxID=3034021 RepID=UPI00384BEA73